MWVTILLQVIFFAVSHAPELAALVKSIASLIFKHAGKPEFSSMVREFAAIAPDALRAGNPKPLRDFFDRISKA